MSKANLVLTLLLAIFFLCMAMVMVSCSTPHHCPHEIKPRTNKIYDREAEPFQYERWHETKRECRRDIREGRKFKRRFR